MPLGFEFPQAVLRTVDGALEAALRQLERVFGQLLFVNVVDRAGHAHRAAVVVALGRAAAAEPAIAVVLRCAGAASSIVGLAVVDVAMVVMARDARLVRCAEFLESPAAVRGSSPS